MEIPQPGIIPKGARGHWAAKGESMCESIKHRKFTGYVPRPCGRRRGKQNGLQLSQGRETALWLGKVKEEFVETLQLGGQRILTHRAQGKCSTNSKLGTGREVYLGHTPGLGHHMQNWCGPPPRTHHKDQEVPVTPHLLSNQMTGKPKQGPAWQSQLSREVTPLPCCRGLSC